jgi:putative ATP-dependent endonuclease of OLD family
MLPDALTRERGFWCEVTHGADAVSQVNFHSGSNACFADDGTMLAWLRRQMPVFWMTEGMMGGKRGSPVPAEFKDIAANELATEVGRHYQDLLEGTAADVYSAIESGSAAARQLLLDRASLLPGHTTPLIEILEEISGQRESRRSSGVARLLENSGTAAHRLGLLLLVGALLRSGAGRVEEGMTPLTLIENPEAHLHPMTLASIWSVLDRIGGQKIIATHSGALLACARVSSVRRLTRSDGLIKEWRVPDGALTADELRRYSYHLRGRRSEAVFARCWLLVEGETEFWLMDELARLCGYELASEGVACVEFAQCGLTSLFKVARHLGIEWHLLADGDAAGQNYVRCARDWLGATAEHRWTLLRERDVEHCFWDFGYQDVFRRAAYPPTSGADVAVQRRVPSKTVIARAIERHSKPSMALLLLDAVMDRGPEAIPPPLRRAIETCIRLARRGPAESAARSQNRVATTS